MMNQYEFVYLSLYQHQFQYSYCKRFLDLHRLRFLRVSMMFEFEYGVIDLHLLHLLQQ